MAALYAMSRELAGTRGVRELQNVAVRHIAKVFRTQVVVLLPQADGRLAPADGGRRAVPDGRERAGGQPVGPRARPGRRTGHRYAPGRLRALPAADRLARQRGRARAPAPGSRPLQAPEQLTSSRPSPARPRSAIERARLAEDAERAQVRAETERLRNSLLSSSRTISATPLASITGAAQHLARERGAPRRPTPAATCWSPSTRRPTG